MEKLWTTGAVGLKTPRQLLHLVWWNNTRMLGMRGRQEHLNCKVQDFKEEGNYYALDENENLGKQVTQKQDASTATRYFKKMAMKEILMLR